LVFSVVSVEIYQCFSDLVTVINTSRIGDSYQLSMLFRLGDSYQLPMLFRLDGSYLDINRF